MACENGQHEGSGKFCSKCGQGIAKKCENCDAALEKPYKFCGECGSQQGQTQGAHVLQTPAATLPVVAPVPKPRTIVMPKADVFIPDPSPEEGISQQDKAYYEKWVIDVLEPILGVHRLTVLTSRHEQFPVTGVRFQLIEQAARNCEKVLFALMPALAGRTMMEMFKAHSDKMVFLRESDDDGGNSFKHIVEQRFVINSRTPAEVHQMCNKLFIQIHGRLTRALSSSSAHQSNPYSKKENPSVRPKELKGSHSYEEPSTCRAPPATPADGCLQGNPSVRGEMSRRGRAEPPRKLHVDSVNRVSGSSSSLRSAGTGERRSSMYTQRQENNNGSGDEQMEGDEEQDEEEDQDDEDEDEDKEYRPNHDRAEERPRRRGSDASSCTGSVKSEIAPQKDTTWGSDDTAQGAEKKCINIGTPGDTRDNTSSSGLATTSSPDWTSMEISRLCYCSDEDEVQNIIEVIVKADWSKEGLDRIISHHPSQKLACHVIPQASSTRRLCVLGKLFVFGGSCPALQLEAGHVLRDTVFRILSHSHEILGEIIELEKVLRHGLNCKDSLLVGLFAEIYKLTIFSIVLGNRHRSTGDQFQQFSCLEVALQDFLDKCCKFHPTKSHFLKFQLEMALDVLQPDILSNHNDILETLQLLVESAKTNQTPQDRRQVEEAVAKSLEPRKFKDSERCLLLHYFASAIQNNFTLLTLCKQVFRQELARAKRKKDEQLLFSCAVLFEQMCHFVSRKETIDEIMVDKTRQNPFLSLLDACPKNSLHCLKQLLAPLLYHPSPLIRSKATDALLPAETNGDLSPESKARYVEYQRQHLEKKLLRFGVLLLQDCDVRCDEDEGVVTYKGELHTGKKGVRRILCKAPAASTVADLDDLGDGPDHALLRMMEVLDALNADQQPSHRADDDRHFIQVLIQMSRPMIVVVDQDWELPTLSHILLEDLRSNHPRIGLQNKMGIIRSIIEAARIAHSKEILLRAFSAESFLVKTRVDGTMKVIFWDVNAARRGIFDSTHELHYTGNKQDSSLAVLWLAPESILQCHFDERSEVYSLAKGCYEILCHGIYPHTGHSGLDTASVIRQNLQYMNLPGRRLGVPMSVYLLILQCLLVNPTKRPTRQAFYDAINATDLNAEDKKYPASTLDFLKTLAGIQAAHTLDKRLPKEFEQDRKSTDIGDRGSKLEDLYCAAMQEHVPTSISQCEADEIRGHDDPRRMEGSIGLFEACIMKKSTDEKERTNIISLKHKNLPKNMKFLRNTSGSGCDHIALRMFVSSQCEDLLTYFLKNQPRLDARIAFYLQICDVIKYLHENDLILCYLNPEHIMVIDGGKQLVLSHLSRLTRVAKKRGESARDVIVRPFLDKWPQNAARWSPLECNESGCFSMESDVAMIALCILQLESAIGKGKDVPIKDTVPYSYIPADNLVEAQRCHYNPPQSPKTPNWLYKLCKAMIVNQDFRRPPLDDQVSSTDVNQAFGRPPKDDLLRVTSKNVVTPDNTTGVITFLRERRFSGREKNQCLQIMNMRKRVSDLLDEEEAELLVNGISIAKRGSMEHQVEVRRKTARLSAPEPTTKDKTFLQKILRLDKKPKQTERSRTLPSHESAIYVDPTGEDMYLHLVDEPIKRSYYQENENVPAGQQPTALNPPFDNPRTPNPQFDSPRTYNTQHKAAGYNLPYKGAEGYSLQNIAAGHSPQFEAPVGYSLQHKTPEGYNQQKKTQEGYNQQYKPPEGYKQQYKTPEGYNQQYKAPEAYRLPHQAPGVYNTECSNAPPSQSRPHPHQNHLAELQNFPPVRTGHGASPYAHNQSQTVLNRDVLIQAPNACDIREDLADPFTRRAADNHCNPVRFNHEEPSHHVGRYDMSEMQHSFGFAGHRYVHNALQNHLVREVPCQQVDPNGHPSTLDRDTHGNYYSQHNHHDRDEDEQYGREAREKSGQYEHRSDIYSKESAVEMHHQNNYVASSAGTPAGGLSGIPSAEAASGATSSVSWAPPPAAASASASSAGSHSGIPAAAAASGSSGGLSLAHPPASSHHEGSYESIDEDDKSMEADDELGIGVRLKSKATPPVGATAATKHNQRITNRLHPLTPTQKQKAETETVTLGMAMFKVAKQGSKMYQSVKIAEPLQMLRLQNHKNKGNVRDSHIYEDIDDAFL